MINFEFYSIMENELFKIKLKELISPDYIIDREKYNSISRLYDSIIYNNSLFKSYNKIIDIR